MKIAAAGGNICDYVRGHVTGDLMSEITGPVTLLMNPDNANSTVTVGSSNFDYLSLAPSDESNVFTWVCSTVRTALGESQDLSWGRLGG